MKAFRVRSFLYIMLVIVLVSCGSADNWGGDDAGNNNVTVPEGGSVEIILSTENVSDPNVNANYLPNLDLVITAEDASGFPVRSAEITINYPFAAPFVVDASPCTWDPAMTAQYGFAGNLSAAQVWMQFYDDDGDPVNVPFTVTTDDYGVARVWFDLVTGCFGNVVAYSGIAHTGSISAQSGTAVDTADFSVGN